MLIVTLFIRGKINIGKVCMFLKPSSSIYIKMSYKSLSYLLESFASLKIEK